MYEAMSIVTSLLFCTDRVQIKTRISIQSILIADYTCILKNKRGNVVDSR